MATQETRQPILQAKGLYKRYGHVTAIDGADFELYPGEILAVIGDNGAGKSSLIKALSGAVIPDAGEILLDGQPAKFRSPLDARAAGIETVYQDLAVSPSLDIATNLFLGREQRRKGPLGQRLPDGRQTRHEEDRGRAHAAVCRSASARWARRSRRSPAVSVRVWPWPARRRGPRSS